MNFDSALFLFAFLPVFLLANLYIKDIKKRNYLLAVAGLIFYSFGDLPGLVVLLATIAFNFFLGRQVFNNKKVMISGVVVNILILCVYKYIGFLFSSLGYSRSIFSSLVAPLGISFFIFKCISYIVDSYRNEAAKADTILDFAIYVSFFPQLIAGPISRFSDFKGQLADREVSLDKTVLGLKRFIVGLTKKVVFAGTFEYMTKGAFGDTFAAADVRVAMLGAIAFTMQIYMDFSGYSDMAIGLGAMCGFDTLENFNFPYMAVNITEFWRRWHISLSSWFKDYIYIPLGGNRKGIVRQAINKFVVFFICGIWHGANWTFFLWGAWHGLLSAIESLVKPKCVKFIQDKNPRVVRALGNIYTIVAVVLGFVIFRANSISQGFTVIGSMVGINGTNYQGSVYLANAINPFTMMITMIAVLGCHEGFVNLLKVRLDSDNNSKKIITALGYAFLYVVTITFVATGGFSPFIYQQF